VAIFDATERLLAAEGLHEISVAHILRESGVSRATFYFYFSSKFAVVTGLLARVYDRLFDVVQPFVSRNAGESPEGALHRSLDAAAAIWRQHRPLLRALHEHWAVVAELGAAWHSISVRFTDAVAASIDKDRAAGLAVAGPDSRQLAALLLWSTDQCLYIAGLGADDDLPGEHATVEPLMTMWLGCLYGSSAR
jgi:AcrR family transcriptional regulator